MTQRHANPDHGGQLSAAAVRWGGQPSDWLDLSTGINPEPYPIPDLPQSDWTHLPDTARINAVLDAARAFWNVPDHLDVCVAPGASAIISKLPALMDGQRVYIPQPTYNEHGIAYRQHGWTLAETDADVTVVVNPNNPDGRVWTLKHLPKTPNIIDESFADCMPGVSVVGEFGARQAVVLKSFGKFWGLAGLRLGFAIGEPDLMKSLGEALGPWPISGPALTIATAALSDQDWATATRQRLINDAKRLDALLKPHVTTIVGGTPLFRLYSSTDSAKLHERLASHHILTRVFPYNSDWIRFGLPNQASWARLEMALS